MKIIFRKLNQGSFTPMKWSPGGAGAQQPPSNQSASGFNETDSHQQVKQDFFQHQDNFDRQQQTFEQETQQQNHHQRNVRYDLTRVLTVDWSWSNWWTIMLSFEPP